MIKWITALVLAVAGVVLYNQPAVRVKLLYSSYQSAPGMMAKENVLKKGQKVMRPSWLPLVLEIYSQDEDIKFAEGMVGSCRSIEANNRLKEIARMEGVDPMVRSTSLAHLLSRGRLEVWREITEEDIDFICNSPPHHVVFWKILLLRNTGYTYRVFKGDVHPQRRNFRRVFHECIDMYEQRQFLKKMRQEE